MESLPKVDLVGVGLNATDTMIVLDAYPARGSKTEYGDAKVLPGGQVATAVVACQQWGLKTRYVGRLGGDEAGQIHARAFAGCGVDARVITVPEAASLQSLILVDGGGERTVLCRRDERLAIRPEDLKREWIVSARALHVDGYDTAAATLAAGWAREAGVPVIADLDAAYEGVDELLEKVDYVIVSRDLPGRLTGVSGLGEALRAMQERFGCRLAAATLGEEGVAAWDGERMVHVPAYRVPVADTTGAGDVFHAGFIYGLLQGWELEKQLQFGCAAAALNCTAMGARGGLCEAKKVLALMERGADQ